MARWRWVFTVSTIRVTTTRSQWAKENLFISGNTKMARGKSHGSSVMTTTPWQSDGRIPDLGEESPLTHIFRSHCATIFGSNRTQEPMRNDGILPAFACLKIVTFATVNILASSFAVKARPICSIRSGSDIGSADLFCELHNCINLLCGFTPAATAA